MNNTKNQQHDMATFHTYRCKGCGFEVKTDPRGFYANKQTNIKSN